MIRFFARCVPTEVEANLTSKSGVRSKCRIYLNGDERIQLENWATILLLPEQQLDGLTEYTVSVKCRLDSVGFEKSWSFKTRAK